MKRPNVLISTLAAAALGSLLIAGCHHTASSAMAPPSQSDVNEFDDAVRDGDTTIVSRLISAKPQMVNAKNTEGKTPLTIATEKSDTEMADLLKKHGAHE